MSDKTIPSRHFVSAADLAKLSDALKAARPVIESAASLVRAAASIMKGTK